MRNGWLIAAALAGAAGVVEGADVQIFGIHTPSSGNWSVYARISNPASVNGGGAQVSGLSSITLDMLNNNVVGTGTATVVSSTNKLPFGTSTYSDQDFNPLQYGFWLFRSNGTVDASGAKEIQAAQYLQYQTPTTNPPYERLVLPGIGLTGGSTTVNADYLTATSWTGPVLVASGTYTPSATTGAGSNVGLRIERNPSNIPNLLFDANPGVGFTWQLEPAQGVAVVDAKTFTTGGVVAGTTTTKAGPGDADLSGIVDFNDLVVLAQNYNGTGRTWFQGDFTYDQVVDFNDLVALAQNYNQPVAGDIPGAGGTFEADLAAAFASVPEPGGLGVLCGVVSAGLIGRRRVRSTAKK